MLNKNKIKFIKSLSSKKDRTEAGLFVAEGEKLASEILGSHLTVSYIAGTEAWFNSIEKKILPASVETDVVSQEELNRISFLKTPQPVICLVHLPNYELNLADLNNKLSLILDTVQDPGNLGTILRIADWFGIEHVICSPHTADAFNPKVVQATMGAICRVKIYYDDLNVVLPGIKNMGMPVYGTMLNGENIYTASLESSGFIVRGNESNGIHPSTVPFLDKKLLIPFFPEGQKRSESLNVAVATAIICSEFRRRII